jgi:hypothetical protein
MIASSPLLDGIQEDSDKHNSPGAGSYIASIWQTKTENVEKQRTMAGASSLTISDPLLHLNLLLSATPSRCQLSPETCLVLLGRVFGVGGLPLSFPLRPIPFALFFSYHPVIIVFYTRTNSDAGT